jgi:hypothetical protein
MTNSTNAEPDLLFRKGFGYLRSRSDLMDYAGMSMRAESRLECAGEPCCPEIFDKSTTFEWHPGHYRLLILKDNLFLAE